MNFNGFTCRPFCSTSKCTCGPVERPVEPISAMGWPRVTRSPTVTSADGPDDLGKEGRWIPTTSLEEYGATLCRWFGIAESDLPYVFPNIGAFASTNLGFMA